MKVIYQGIPKAKRDSMIAAQAAMMDPPEKTAQEWQYHATDRDSPKVITEKEKKAEAWRSQTMAEFIDGIDKSDAVFNIAGMNFPKGEVVELADDHPLVSRVVLSNGERKTVPGKMFALINDGAFVQAKDEDKQEQKADEPTQEPQQEGEEPKRRGRPRKDS